MAELKQVRLRNKKTNEAETVRYVMNDGKHGIPDTHAFMSDVEITTDVINNMPDDQLSMIPAALETNANVVYSSLGKDIVDIYGLSHMSNGNTNAKVTPTKFAEGVINTISSTLESYTNSPKEDG